MEEVDLWLSVAPKLAAQSTFVFLPKRWIVERTLAELLNCHRLTGD